MSIFVHDVSLLHLTGVFDWLGDISHLVGGILLIQYQLSHATFRNCLGAYYHNVTDSSLTTPLPRLKSLYYTHMGGLAVSSSHGEERVPQLDTQQQK